MRDYPRKVASNHGQDARAPLFRKRLCFLSAQFVLDDLALQNMIRLAFTRESKDA